MTDKILILAALTYLEKEGQQTDMLLAHWKDLDTDTRKRIKLKLHDNNFVTVAPYSPFHFIIRPEGEKILLTPEKLDDNGNIICKKKFKLELGHKIALAAFIVGLIVLLFGNNIIGRLKETNDSVAKPSVNIDTTKMDSNRNRDLIHH